MPAGGSPFVHFPPYDEAFTEHLREAVETLGYFELSALDKLTSMYRERWEDGISATMFRVSELDGLLSEKGLANPRHAQQATFLRALFNNRRAEALLDDGPIDYASYRFAARAQWLCDEARKLDGTEVAPDGRWPLPLTTCRQEWCPCRFDGMIDY